MLLQMWIHPLLEIVPNKCTNQFQYLYNVQLLKEMIELNRFIRFVSSVAQTSREATEIHTKNPVSLCLLPMNLYNVTLKSWKVHKQGSSILPDISFLKTRRKILNR